MYYKKTNMYGIRRFTEAEGKGPQVFSFGGKRCALNDAQLKALSVEILARLTEGMPVDVAKQEARSRAGNK